MKFHLLVLTSLFVVVNGILLLKMGIMVDYDTEGYFLYASEIKERGWFFKPHLFWYSGYALFIALLTSIYDSQVTVIVGQYFLSYLAMLSLYFSGRKLVQNPWAGFITCVWVTGFFMIQFWNLFLYAESLFISLNCISIYFLIKWVKGEGNLGNYIVGTLVIIFTFFIKPTGIALLGGILLSAGFVFWGREQFKRVKWAGLIGAALLFMLLLNQMLSTYGFVEAYQMGEVVYNIHKLANEDYSRWLILEVPENLFIPSSELSPIIQFVSLIIGNPVYSLQLFGTKLFFYLFYIRPYYSFAHNALALAVLLPVYMFFIQELIKGSISKPFKIFVLGFVLISILSASLMTINWNSRFLMPVLPVIFLVAGNKFALVFEKGYKKRLMPTN